MGRLGDTLRDRRVALGLTIEQVEAGTRIRGRLIEALEAGDYGRLPASGYVRGYISSYARFLELDPIPLLNMYKAETPNAAHRAELNLPQVDEAVAPTGMQHAVPWRAAIAVVVVVALISVSIWAVTRIWRGPESPAPDPVVSPQVETSTPATEPAETPTETTTPPETTTTQEPLAAEPFTLVVKVDPEGASWMKITIDGKKAYEGALAGGQSKTYEVSEVATVSQIGKPSLVAITKDGEPVEIQTGDGVGSATVEATTTGQ